MRRWLIASLGFLSGLLGVPAVAQDYPSRPVRFITDSGPGSAIDATMRIIVDSISKVWGQQAVLINQPGAGGAMAARAAAQAAPDGYTFGMPAVSAFIAVPGGASNLPIQVPKDFVVVAYLGGAPIFLTAAPRLGISTLPELIALAKQKPGELAYGASGAGRLTHLTGEMLQARAGIKLQMIPYSGGTPQALHDVMGGRIPLVFEAYSGVAGAIDAGTLRPIAVASPARVAGFPDLATVAETLPSFEAVGWQALVAPLGTPDAIVQKVNRDVIKALSDPDARARLAKLGRDERPMSPAETLAFIHREQQQWAPILQQLGAAR
jgi:tripartite-type tricarboxylate transporter receptor subunit TctC